MLYPYLTTHRLIPRRVNFRSKIVLGPALYSAITLDAPHLGQAVGLSSSVISLSTVTFLTAFYALFDASTDGLAAAHVDLRPLVIPVRSRVDPLEFGQGTRELAKGPLEPDFQRVDVHEFPTSSRGRLRLVPQIRAIASATTPAARQSSILYAISSRFSVSSKVSSQHRRKSMEAVPEACGQVHSNPSHCAISFRLFE